VSQTTELKQLAGLFFKLGSTAFGGPAAHIAMMEEEIVRRRGWVSREEFLDLVGATNLIPGPNSTEMAIHIGYQRARWAGLLVAGLSFILPAALITGGLAWAYVRFGELPQAAGLLYGVKPVVIMIVLQALLSLSRTAVKTKFLGVVGIAAVALVSLGVHELLVLLGAGLIVPLSRWPELRKRGIKTAVPSLCAAPTLIPWAASATAGGAMASAFGLWPLFAFFLKVGAVLFGSGYVLLAYLRADLVHRWGWLTEAQLLDATAVGQVTPGPLSSTATFIGYLLAGPAGALVSTAGIFLPAFVFVAASGPLVPRLRRSPVAGAFLDGVNVASLALMAVVTWQLGQAAFIDLLSVVLGVAAAIALVRFRVNSAWLVLCAAVIGLLTHAG
jgi:chromate transporter